MAIPLYPASRPLGLADKPLMDEIFAVLQPRVSEFTFANLYLFRHPHNYRLSLLGDSLLVMGIGYDGGDYLLPPLSGDIASAVQLLLTEGRCIYGADDDFVAAYLPDIEVELYQDRDNSDYLYLRQELAELTGNRYHKKKNRLNYFVSRHRYELDDYGRSYQEGSLALLDEWFRVRSELGSRSVAAEVAATREALLQQEELGLEGVVVLVEGVVKGFALGERLNRVTSVCHFEKADPFLEGLSQLLDREFNRRLFNDCTFVNREQDLGEPGLRAAKLSYHPCELINKYRISKKI